MPSPGFAVPRRIAIAFRRAPASRQAGRRLAGRDHHAPRVAPRSRSISAQGRRRERRVVADRQPGLGDAGFRQLADHARGGGDAGDPPVRLARAGESHHAALGAQKAASKPILIVRGRSGVVCVPVGDAERVAEREAVAARVGDIVDVERQAEAAEIEPGAELAVDEAALVDVERRADAEMGLADIADRAVEREREPGRQRGPEMGGGARAGAGDVGQVALVRGGEGGIGRRQARCG